MGQGEERDRAGPGQSMGRDEAPLAAAWSGHLLVATPAMSAWHVGSGSPLRPCPAAQAGFLQAVWPRQTYCRDCGPGGLPAGGVALADIL